MSDKCDQEIYDNGEHVFTIASEHTADIEKFVEAVREMSGQKVDWHWMAGRGIVKAIGDLEAVRRAIHVQLGEFGFKHARFTTENDSTHDTLSLFK